MAVTTIDLDRPMCAEVEAVLVAVRFLRTELLRRTLPLSCQVDVRFLTTELLRRIDRGLSWPQNLRHEQ